MDEVVFLSVEDLLVIAEVVIDARVVVRDHGLLQSAAHRPALLVFGEDVYPGLDGKAAALMSSVVANHALLDGNKRLGWAAAVVFCELNGHDLVPPTEDDAYDLVLSIAQGQVDVVTIAATLAPWMTGL